MKTRMFNLAVYFILYILAYISDIWFVFFPKEYFFYLIYFFSFIELILLFKINLKFDANKFIIPLLLIFVVLMFSFPVKNLKMGDGILLLNNFALENYFFGYHLIFDEILEGLIHSFVNQIIVFFVDKKNIINPMLPYQITSNFFGILFIIQLVYYFKKLKINFFGYFLVFTSGGMYLFFGYSENYTIVTFFI